MSKVIIQCGSFMKVDDFNKLRESIAEDFDRGVLVLPPYCTLKAVLDSDSDIEIMEGDR